MNNNQDRITALILLIASMTMFTIPTNAFATPKSIMITRHGDKPPKGFCLSLQGLERAASFPYYFTKTSPYSTFPITHVFAAFRGEPDPYIRCQQTCQPVADHLQLPLNIKYTQAQIKEVVQEILTNPHYNNANVLMCWEHAHIRPLVIALGGEDPGYWASNIFDQVYLLSFEGKSKPKLQKILQKLMFGDRREATDEPAPLPEVAVPCPKVK